MRLNFKPHTLCAALCAASLIATAPARAQWTGHFSYTGSTLTAVVDGVPVCGSSYALFYYDPADSYLGRLTKVNGLSTVGISTIAAADDRLIVGYSDGDIDIVDMAALSTVNIPELRLNESVTSKSVNDVCESGGMAYCATSGGVMEINIAKSEVRSFWRVASGGVLANAVAVSDGRIYVGTSSGVYTASLSSRLLEDYSQWTLLSSPAGNVVSLAAFDGAVYAAVGTAGESCPVWKIASDLSATNVFTSSAFRRLTARGDYMVCTQGWKVTVLSKDLKELAVVTGVKSSADAGSNDVVSSAAFRSAHLIDDKTIAIADANAGLIITDFNSVGKAVLPDGPYDNSCQDIYGDGADVYVSGSGGNRTTFSVLHGGSWEICRASSYSYDTRRFARDPVSSQLYVSTFGSGVYMVDDRKLGQRFYSDNSPLSPAFSDVVRTDAIAVDKSQNLYVVNNSVSDGLKVMDKDGAWNSYTYGPMSGTTSTLGMIATSNGNIWHWSSSPVYLCVFNINGTPETDDDDTYMSTSGGSSSDPQYVGSISLTDESSGETVGNKVTTVAASADGSIWVGTSGGILVTTDNATMLKTGSVTFNQIKVPRNDGTDLADYLLAGQYINDIKVDGADRKWIATANGVYLVSADGISTLHHFTASDSPLPSDNVLKVGIRESDGEVFFSTQWGMVSFKGDATPPSDKLVEIRIHPNPVSVSGFGSQSGTVTFTGFENGSHVFITDIAGNRVYRTTSLGGMAQWNLRREGGGRVANGIYIVWAVNSDGKTSAMGKFLVKE